MRISFEEAARVMGARAVRTSPGEVTGAAIHSKKVKPGDLFFALQGTFSDGHDFVRDALFRGAAGAVVERYVPDAGPQFLTSDVASALVRLASWVRDTLDPLVVGITGSTGKTTVKDLLASITSGRMQTVASPQSFNNDLGVPLTLTACRRETEVLICEMGTRGPGHISRLCEYARPHVGIVTNVGVTHYQMFGSQEAIAAAKQELVRSLPEGGAAVLNADDPLVMGMAAECAAEIITFGLGSDADVRGSDIMADPLGKHSFTLERAGEAVPVALPVAGAHQVRNALAASAAAVSVGLTLTDCRRGLESAKLSPWRMEVQVVSGVIFINDAYNANPASVESALQTAAGIASGGRLIAVLGWMAELGEISETEHRRIGALASALASRLVVVGPEAWPMAEEARATGMSEVLTVEDGGRAIEALGRLEAGDVVLVKASRAAGLENVAEMAMQEIRS